MPILSINMLFPSIKLTISFSSTSSEGIEYLDTKVYIKTNIEHFVIEAIIYNIYNILYIGTSFLKTTFLKIGVPEHIFCILLQFRIIVQASFYIFISHFACVW